MNYVNRAEIVLTNGELIQTTQLNLGKLNSMKSQHTLEGEIYSKLDTLLAKNAKQINKSSDKVRLGYPALKYVRRNGGRNIDLLPTFFGSEGTLGVITEVILRLEVLPPRPHRLVANFSTIKTAQEFMSFAEKLQPLSVEIFDAEIFNHADEYGKKPEILSKKIDKGYIVYVSFNDKSRKSRRKIKKCQSFLPKSANAVAETLKNTTSFDAISDCLSIYLNDSAKGERPNLLNDFYLPNEHLEDFIEAIHKLGKKYKKTLEPYGSYLTSIYSLRPEFNLGKIEEKRAALMLLKDFNELLKE